MCQFVPLDCHYAGTPAVLFGSHGPSGPCKPDFSRTPSRSWTPAVTYTSIERPSTQQHVVLMPEPGALASYATGKCTLLAVGIAAL